MRTVHLVSTLTAAIDVLTRQDGDARQAMSLTGPEPLALVRQMCEIRSFAGVALRSLSVYLELNGLMDGMGTPLSHVNECDRSSKNQFIIILTNFYVWSDIDECSRGTHTCSSGSTCINDEGSFRCEDPILCTPGTRPSSDQRKCVGMSYDVYLNLVCLKFPKLFHS